MFTNFLQRAIFFSFWSTTLSFSTTDVSSLERFLYPSYSLDIVTSRPLWYISDSIVYTPRRCAAAWFQWQWHSSDRRHVTSWAGPDTRSGAILALCAGPHELTIVETRFSYSTLILSDAALVICSSAVVMHCRGPGESCDTDSASYLLRHRGRSWESSGNSWQREIFLSVAYLPVIGATVQVQQTSSNSSLS